MVATKNNQRSASNLYNEFTNSKSQTTLTSSINSISLLHQHELKHTKAKKVLYIKTKMEYTYINIGRYISLSMYLAYK